MGNGRDGFDRGCRSGRRVGRGRDRGGGPGRVRGHYEAGGLVLRGEYLLHIEDDLVCSWRPSFFRAYFMLFVS